MSNRRRGRGPNRQQMREMMAQAGFNDPYPEAETRIETGMDDPTSILVTRLSEMATSLRADTLREGTDLLNSGRLEEGRDFFFRRAKTVVGTGVRLPSIGGVEEDGDAVKSDLYTKMSPIDVALLMACCNGMAKYYTMKKDLESALCWYEEVNILYANTYFMGIGGPPLFDWMDFALDIPELSYQRIVGLTGAAEIFRTLGNTATLVERRWTAHCYTNAVPPRHRTAAFNRAINVDVVTQDVQLRHPDPKLCHTLKLTHPRLQIQGSWKKYSTKPGEKGPGPRQRVASFIWKSKLYVFGGWMGEMNFVAYKDLWCLDLTKTKEEERVWRKLPDYPVPVRSAMSFSFVVHKEEKRAYLITGRQDVDYFDLVTERWGNIRTTFVGTEEDRACGVRGNWPFVGQELQDAAVVINGDKIYTFGGTHEGTMLGCNLLMELDLPTKKWRRLTGYVVPQDANDFSMPGPRKSPCGWLGPCKDRIYIFLGHAERVGARMKNQKHGASDAYGYHDFWSYSISQKKWRRERISGNPPLSRTEMGCTFNEKLNKAIVFGGFAPVMPSFFLEQGNQYNFSYYADTFAYDYAESSDDSNSSLPSYTTTDPEVLTAPSETSYPSWKQVITRGFPTYRCHCRLESDPDTGKVYLFGGYTNSDYVPSRSDYMTRPFGDVWQLRMDVPGEGGDFSSVDVEEEARTARAGPWKRCFTCGNTGIWRRCSGKCGGKAFFCDVGCQREGWKEHKRFHACGKA